MNPDIYLVDWWNRKIVDGDRHFARVLYLVMPILTLVIGFLFLAPIGMVLEAPGPLKQDDLLLALVIFGIPSIVVIVFSVRWARSNHRFINEAELIDAKIAESTSTYRRTRYGGSWRVSIVIAVTTPTGETFIRRASMDARSPDGLPPPVGTRVKVLYLNDDQFEVM